MKSLTLSQRMRGLLGLLVLAGTSWVSGAQAADNEITVPINRSELISLPADISEVIIANPEIADVYVHGKSKVSVIGRRVGATSLRVLDADSNDLRSVTVRVTYDLPAIRQALYQFFPYEDIAVQTVNNNLALTGMVSTPAVAQKAIRIANEFLIPSDEVRPRQEDFSPSGSLPGADSGVINMLKVTSGQQVMLRVRVGEIQRSTLKQLGFNWSVLDEGAFALTTGNLLNTAGFGVPQRALDLDGNPTGTIAGGLVPQEGGGLATARPGSFIGLAGNKRIGNTNITGVLDALEENNLFKLMAEPNLVAMSGEEAEFLSGGEFPILVATEDSVNVEYRSYGVSVRFRPLVLSDSRIRLSVSPEVSELTDNGAVELDNITIPALNTRRARTTVELAPGEGFMIAGLIRDRSDSSIQQVPGAGEIPILSALFRNTSYQREEQELVIAVTPYLVNGTATDDIRLPSDDFRPASMMEQFFYGALGSLQNNERTISQTPPLEGPIGFMVD